MDLRRFLPAEGGGGKTGFLRGNAPLSVVETATAVTELPPETFVAFALLCGGFFTDISREATLVSWLSSVAAARELSGLVRGGAGSLRQVCAAAGMDGFRRWVEARAPVLRATGESINFDYHVAVADPDAITKVEREAISGGPRGTYIEGLSTVPRVGGSPGEKGQLSLVPKRPEPTCFRLRKSEPQGWWNTRSGKGLVFLAFIIAGSTHWLVSRSAAAAAAAAEAAEAAVVRAAVVVGPIRGPIRGRRNPAVGPPAAAGAVRGRRGAIPLRERPRLPPPAEDAARPSLALRVPHAVRRFIGCSAAAARAGVKALSRCCARLWHSLQESAAGLLWRRAQAVAAAGPRAVVQSAVPAMVGGRGQLSAGSEGAKGRPAASGDLVANGRAAEGAGGGDSEAARTGQSISAGGEPSRPPVPPPTSAAEAAAPASTGRITSSSADDPGAASTSGGGGGTCLHPRPLDAVVADAESGARAPAIAHPLPLFLRPAAARSAAEAGVAEPSSASGGALERMAEQLRQAQLRAEEAEAREQRAAKQLADARAAAVAATGAALECGVCMERAVDTVLSCGHTICRLCVHALPQPKVCPTCRAQNVSWQTLFI